MAFLEKAIEGAPLGDPSDEEMAEIVKPSIASGQRGKSVRVVLDANVVFAGCGLAW